MKVNDQTAGLLCTVVSETAAAALQSPNWLKLHAHAPFQVSGHDMVPAINCQCCSSKGAAINAWPELIFLTVSWCVQAAAAAAAASGGGAASAAAAAGELCATLANTVFDASSFKLRCPSQFQSQSQFGLSHAAYSQKRGSYDTLQDPPLL